MSELRDGFAPIHLAVRIDRVWGLREVKSSSGPKDQYIDDIAVQVYVLRGAGITLPSVELLHVNTAYARGASGITWAEFFARLDIGEAVGAALADLPGRLPEMRECLNALALPEIAPGPQCASPYPLRILEPMHGGQTR